MKNVLFNVLLLLLLLLVLYAQVLIESFLRWFTPDLFFIALVFLVLIYRGLSFVSFFIAALFYDVFTNNFFGGTVLSLTIIFYIMELFRFHQIRFSFLGSSAFMAVFYALYIVLQHVISHGIESLFVSGSIYIVFQLLSTLLTWMLLWKAQSQQG